MLGWSVLSTIATFSLFSANVAHAQANDKKGYVGFEAGLAFADINADATAQLLANASGETVSYSYDTSALTGRLSLGYWFEDNFAFEIGAFATGDLNATYVGTTFTASENFSASGLDFAILLSPSDNGWFFKGGMHSSELASDAAVNFIGFSLSGTATVSGTGGLFGFGYDWEDSSGDFARLSYTFYDSLGGVSGSEMGLLSVSYNLGF
jgi:hypothetical protein